MKRLSLAAIVIASVSWAGFEIGNGRKVVENVKGGYSIVVPEKSEVGKSKNYTEVIAPLSEGTPRARLQINLVKNSGFLSINELVDSQKEGNWTPVTLAGLSGIQKEETLPTRLTQIEIRLFLRAEEMVIVNLEGVPGPSLMTPFESIKQSLESLKIKN